MPKPPDFTEDMEKARKACAFHMKQKGGDAAKYAWAICTNAIRKKKKEGVISG